MGKYRFAYWFILITTLIMESSLQILYSYVTKKTLNAIEFQNMQLFRTAVVVCVVIVILKCLFPYLRYFQIRLVRKMVYELKLKLYEKLLNTIIAWATMAVGFTTALSAIFPAAADPFVNKAIAIGIITVLSIINLFGVNIMAYLNNISTIAKMIPMVIFVIGGLFFLKGSNFTPFLKDGMNMNSISAAVITVFYAFTGFENVGVAAGDMENPKKNVPKALIISMSIVSVIYFLIQFNCIGTLGTNLSGTSTPVADAMGTFLGNKGALLVTLGTLVSIAGLNICGSFNTPRCAQALADGGLLPKTLSKCNRRKVPYVAVFITGMLAVLLTLTGSFTELAAISVISRFSQYIPTCLAVIALRKKSDGKKDGYRVPLGYTFPVIAILASIWLIFHTEVYKLIAGLGAMVVVAPIYFIMKKRKSAELS